MNLKCEFRINRISQIVVEDPRRKNKSDGDQEDKKEKAVLNMIEFLRRERGIEVNEENKVGERKKGKSVVKANQRTLQIGWYKKWML